MRVSVVTPFHLPRVSGMCRYLQRVTEGLAAAGHDVEVLTTDALRLPSAADPGWVVPSVEVISGVTVRRFPLARRTHRALASSGRARQRVQGRMRGLPRRRAVVRPLENGPISAGLAAAARRAVMRRDAVVAAAFPYLTTVGVGWGPRRRARLVALPLFHGRSGVAVTRAGIVGLDRFDTVVGLTRAELADLAARGVRRPQPVVIAPGSDGLAAPVGDSATARAVLGLPAGPTVGFVGRLVAYKGLDTLSCALPTLVGDHPGIHVLVAGAREPWPALDATLNRLADVVEAGGGRLTFAPDYPDDLQSDLLTACDVVMTPSREESFGLVTLDALAAGRAVVSVDLPVVREVVRHGIDGLLVPPGDPPALASAVGRLLVDPSRAEAMGVAGRARAERDHRWDDVVERWAALLEG